MLKGALPGLTSEWGGGRLLSPFTCLSLFLSSRQVKGHGAGSSGPAGTGQDQCPLRVLKGWGGAGCLWGHIDQ